MTPETRALFTGMKTGSGTFRMNVALSELPDFTCRPGTNAQDHHGSGIVIGPSLGYLERAYLDARMTGWSREPVVEMLIPSTLDDTLAPPGKHVASLFVQHVAPHLPDGRSWADVREKEAFADLVIDTVTRYAPNFERSVIAAQILSPLDIEQRFGMVDGDIFHGALSLDQLFSARPRLGYADYRMPIDGLYLCGVGRASGRRRHRRAGAQRGARDHPRLQGLADTRAVRAPARLVDDRPLAVLRLVEVLRLILALHLADAGRVEIGAVEVGAGNVRIGEIGGGELALAQVGAGKVGPAQRGELHEHALHVGALEGRAVELGALEGAAHQAHRLVLLVGRQVGAVEFRLGGAGVGEVGGDVRAGEVGAVELATAELGGEQAGILQVGAGEVRISAPRPDRERRPRGWCWRGSHH